MMYMDRFQLLHRCVIYSRLLTGGAFGLYPVRTNTAPSAPANSMKLHPLILIPFTHASARVPI